MAFLGVDIGDPEALVADEKLQVYLQEKADLVFAISPAAEYREAVYSLAKWRDSGSDSPPMLARVTPGVFIYARMLGADLEVVGTYVSRATGQTTYNSYLAVPKSEFAGSTLAELAQFLRNPGKTPPTFVYHDKFSASSYMLPALFFRRNNIYAVSSYAPGHGEYTPLPSRDLRAGGSSLSARIANHTATPDDLKTLNGIQFDLAQSMFCAVWDSTAKKAQDPRYAGLNFLKLPQSLPNDLLVVSGGTGGELKNRLRLALSQMPPGRIDRGDFMHWIDFNAAEAFGARQALAELEQALKHGKPAIKVEVAPDEDNPPDSRQLEAVRNAVRLSEPEFVLYNRDAFKMADLTWVVRKSGDGLLLIRSQYADIKETARELRVSANATNSMAVTNELLRVLARQLPRARYVWLHDDRTPRILRDLGSDFQPGQKLVIERIEWRDRERNDYVIKQRFTTAVKGADPYSIALEEADGFLRREGVYDFDPMSNVDYRSYLVPQSERSRGWLVASYLGLGLFVTACLSPLLALRNGRT